jgi:hypothetical protein
MYEVEIHTDNIIQIGWATPESKMDAKGGIGVGDDKYSYSYDGHRQKKWHGGLVGKVRSAWSSILF